MKAPFMSHFGTKLMALVMAIFIWWFAYAQNMQESSILYTVRVTAPAGIKVEPESQEVYLEVKAPRRDMERLKSEPDNMIDKKIEERELEKFAGTDTFPFSVPLTESDLDGQSRLAVANLPRTLDVTLSRIKRKELKVRVVVTGQPTAGYAAEEVRVRPATVWVVGPQSLLDKTDYINTAELDISDLTSTLTDPSLAIVDEIEGQKVQVLRTRVRVTVPIMPRRKTRVFEKVPVDVKLTPNYAYRVTPSPPVVKVEVEGPEEAVDGLKVEDIVVYASVSSEQGPTSTGVVETLVVNVPAGLTAKAVPDTAGLSVTERP